MIEPIDESGRMKDRAFSLTSQCFRTLATFLTTASNSPPSYLSLWNTHAKFHLKKLRSSSFSLPVTTGKEMTL
jgi:hypothetical protein